ncbi:hypothetical protein HRbin30_01555 [bacterium HR30]|nr:hypothetical protein HRbin30_01555 [bacterium HR30]
MKPCFCARRSAGRVTVSGDVFFGPSIPARWDPERRRLAGSSHIPTHAYLLLVADVVLQEHHEPGNRRAESPGQEQAR